MREREEEGGENQERERREGDERKERKQDGWSFFVKMRSALYVVASEIYLP